MKNDSYTIGIDIGSEQIKAVVIDAASRNEKQPTILAALSTASSGVTKGYINNQDAVEYSLNELVEKVLKKYPAKYSDINVAINGIGLRSQYVRTSNDIQNKSREIEAADIDAVVAKAEDLFSKKYPNKKILYINSQKYRVDDRDVLGSPVGMYGETIEAKILFVTVPEHHYESCIRIFESSSLSIDNLVAAPLAEAALLSPAQKNNGCVLLNIGAQTSSMSVYENGFMSSLEVFPIGSNDITNDLALGHQISREEAHELKLDAKNKASKQTQEIIQARMYDILELMERHLIRIKKNRLLPAGVIITGGSAYLEGIEAYTKSQLKIPAETIKILKKSPSQKRASALDPKFSLAYALTLPSQNARHFKKSLFSIKKIFKNAKKLFDELMP